jgi:hypothetical protein
MRVAVDTSSEVVIRPGFAASTALPTSPSDLSVHGYCHCAGHKRRTGAENAELRPPLPWCFILAVGAMPRAV